MEDRNPKGIYYIVFLIAIGIMGCQIQRHPMPVIHWKNYHTPYDQHYEKHIQLK